MRLLLLSALFLVICPPRRISTTRRFKKFLFAVVYFHAWFFIRALMMGLILSHFDAVPYIQTIDLPFRLVIIACVLAVGMSTLDENPLTRRKNTRAGFAFQINLLLLTLACFVGGCKGSISNNSVTINAGEGSSYTPYIIVAIMIGWSYYKDFRNKRSAVRAQGSGKPWRKDGSAKRRADLTAADDVGDLI